MAIYNNGAFVAPNATVVGNVTLEENASIWYGAVLRGDNGDIYIGAGTNIQDNCVIHDRTIIGENCTVGHGAIVHGCTIGNNTMVGMGAIVLSGAKIGNNCLIGAGALVTGKTKAPAGEVVKKCMEKGVLCLTAKDKVRLLPALNIPMDDLEFAIETIKEVAKELGGNV